MTLSVYLAGIHSRTWVVINTAERIKCNAINKWIQRKCAVYHPYSIVATLLLCFSSQSNLIKMFLFRNRKSFSPCLEEGWIKIKTFKSKTKKNILMDFYLLGYHLYCSFWWKTYLKIFGWWNVIIWFANGKELGRGHEKNAWKIIINWSAIDNARFHSAFTLSCCSWLKTLWMLQVFFFEIIWNEPKNN